MGISVHKLKKKLLLYGLPSQAIADAFPLIFGAYITILSLLRDLATTDSQNQLDNETLLEQSGIVDEFYNYTVAELADNYTVSVSNAVLWVCREGSPDGDFYRELYRMAIGCLITFHLITGFSRFFTTQFWSRYGQDRGIAFMTIMGAILLNISFLFLLLSFDITPWSCISKPSTVDIEYISFSNRYDIQIEHTPSAITFQKVASIISLVLAFSWLVARIVFFCRDVINDNVDHRTGKYCDEPDTGAAEELLEVNDVEENN